MILFLEPLANTHDFLDLGPSRVPLWIDLQSFSVKFLSQGLSLFDFIALSQDLDLIQYPKALGLYLQLQLLKGHAIVFIDSNFQFPYSPYPSSTTLTSAVSSFVDEFFSPLSEESNVPSISLRARTFDEDQPFLKGGNQVLLTFNSVGYYLHHIVSKFGLVHLIVDSLGIESIRFLTKSLLKQSELDHEQFLLSRDFVSLSKSYPLLLKIMVLLIFLNPSHDCP